MIRFCTFLSWDNPLPGIKKISSIEEFCALTMGIMAWGQSKLIADVTIP
jgi:hypothetical protein